ncbi:MAG: hypothetical protein AB2556_08200 [Candidatus Thiodiazotropha sp.]
MNEYLWFAIIELSSTDKYLHDNPYANQIEDGAIAPERTDSQINK